MRRPPRPTTGRVTCGNVSSRLSPVRGAAECLQKRLPDRGTSYLGSCANAWRGRPSGRLPDVHTRPPSEGAVTRERMCDESSACRRSPSRTPRAALRCSRHALSTASQRAGEAVDEWCWPSALVGGGVALGESVDACASAAGARLGCGDGGAAATFLGCWSRECGGSRRLSRAGQGGVCGRV